MSETIDLEDIEGFQDIPQNKWISFLLKATTLNAVLDDRLGDIFGSEIYCKFSLDPYDSSIELYFSPKADQSWKPTEGQWVEVLNMGVIHGWMNFTDGTEIHFGRLHPFHLSERRKIPHPRWTEEKWVAAERSS